MLRRSLAVWLRIRWESATPGCDAVDDEVQNLSHAGSLRARSTHARVYLRFFFAVV